MIRCLTLHDSKNIKSRQTFYFSLFRASDIEINRIRLQSNKFKETSRFNKHIYYEFVNSYVNSRFSWIPFFLQDCQICFHKTFDGKLCPFVLTVPFSDTTPLSVTTINIKSKNAKRQDSLPAWLQEAHRPQRSVTCSPVCEGCPLSCLGEGYPCPVWREGTPCPVQGWWRVSLSCWRNTPVLSWGTPSPPRWTGPGTGLCTRPVHDRTGVTPPPPPPYKDGKNQFAWQIRLTKHEKT